MIRRFEVVLDVDKMFSCNILEGCIYEFLINKYDGNFLSIEIKEIE